MQQFGEVVAEDLGPVPPYLRSSLERSFIPGYRVLRWEKDGDRYRDPGTWPVVSTAAHSTHDTSGIADWYDHLTKGERTHLAELPAFHELDPAKGYDDRVRDTLLRGIYAAPSILSIVPLQDASGTRERINTPGTVSESNWSYRMAADLETLERDVATAERLRHLATETGRAKE